MVTNETTGELTLCTATPSTLDRCATELFLSALAAASEAAVSGMRMRASTLKPFDCSLRRSRRETIARWMSEELTPSNMLASPLLKESCAVSSKALSLPLTVMRTASIGWCCDPGLSGGGVDGGGPSGGCAGGGL